MALSIQLVLSNLVVASLIGVIAWIVGRSGRRAALAHVLWIVFFVKLVTPPIVVVPVLSVPQASNFVSAIVHGSWSNQMIDVWIGLVAVWLLGCSVIAARGLVRFIKFRQLVCREGVRIDESGVVNKIHSPVRANQGCVVHLPGRADELGDRMGDGTPSDPPM